MKRRSTGTLYSSSDVRRSLNEAKTPDKLLSDITEELENLTSYSDDLIASLNSAIGSVETDIKDPKELANVLKGLKDVEKGITSAQNALDKFF